MSSSLPPNVVLVIREPETAESASASQQTKIGGDGDEGITNGDIRKEREGIIRIDAILDKETYKYRYVRTAKSKKRKEKFRRYIITVIRCISERGNFHGQYIVEIQGKYIRDTLLAFYHDVESISFPEFISLQSEYDELKKLYHARHEFSRKLEEVQAAETRNEAQVLELTAINEFIEEHFSDVSNQLGSLRESHITFLTLWTIFPPYILVYSYDPLQQGRLYRVKSSGYTKDKDERPYFSVMIDYIDSDGEQIGFVHELEQSIYPFDGSTLIFKLPFFPLASHPEHHAIRQSLIDRSDKVLRLTGRQLQEYKGHALDIKGKKFNSHGRVLIDPVTFGKMQPENSPIPKIRTSLQAEKLTTDQKMMLNPLLYGFSLGDKVWGSFAVSSLKDVVWNDEIIESLVLQKERKDFIRALIRSHGLRTDEGTFDDFVRDKGKGLVGLLAGPPGVGKTLTAEAVAEIAHRPLYTINSGELGETSSSVQSELAKIFELAEAWKAVVLLDEADVFLAKRDNVNLSRNAITSVFLRNLEYYQGILLLTTNRHDSLDVAFQSRIHFYFKYDELGPDARELIWRRLLEKVKTTTQVTVEVEERDIIGLKAITLNGRQIKNIVSIAHAVAAEKREPVTLNAIMLAAGFAEVPWIEPQSPENDRQQEAEDK